MKSDNYTDTQFNEKGNPISLNIKDESDLDFIDEIEEAINMNSPKGKKPKKQKQSKAKKPPKVKVKTSKKKVVKDKPVKENKSPKEKSKFRILPDSTWLGAAMLAAGFAEVLFLFFIIMLDVLPLKYMLLVIFTLLAVDAVIVYLATSPSKHGTRRIGALVIIFVVLIATLTGDYYIYCTNDTLNKISEQRDTWEYYDVMALKEGSYQSVDDIRGETVYVTDMESKQLNEAKERLITKAEVEYIEEPDFMTVGKHLVATGSKEQEGEDPSDSENTESADKTSTTNEPEDAIILVSNSQRKLLGENLKGFKKNTKIIYKMKVKKRANDSSKKVDVTKDSFNVLISGLDSWGTIDEGGLSDVNMVLTINPTTREALLTSIPRDSYLTLHSYGAKDKLTHTGIYGEEETKKTIEDFLDIDINYTIRVNFSMLVDIVDAVGGITIDNKIDFYSTPKGWHYPAKESHYMGNRALWFARERKSFEDGDMQRNKNQQMVFEALFKKVTSSKVILTSYTQLLNAVEDEMATDMSQKEMKSLVKMQLKDMKPWTVKKENIVGTTGGAPCYSMGNQELSCVFPSEESVEAAKKKIHDVMYPASVNDDSNSENKESESK